MDSQNQNTNPQQSPTSGKGGQRVIQPSPTSSEEMNTQQPSPEPSTSNQLPEASRIASEPPTNIQAPVQQQSISETPTVIAGGEAPTGKPFTPTSPTNEYKPKRHWLRWSFIGLIVVIIVGAGVLLGTNYNFKATLLGGKFRQYSYENDGSAYKLIYFKSSVIEKNPTVANSQDNAIVSPPNVDGSLPLQLIITKAAPSASSSLVANAENCIAKSGTSAKVITAFTVYIPAAAQNVKACSITEPNFDSNAYIATYTNSSNQSIDSVSIGVSFDVQELLSNHSYVQKLDSENAPITPYQSDIKTILNSVSN